MRLSIRDRAFGHALFSNNPMPPVSFARDIIWDRDAPADEKTIYTDACIMDAPPGARIWLLEPWDNNAALYDHVANHRWKSVWTHDRLLISMLDEAVWVPFGGCWIAPKDRRLWDKTEDVSIIASIKTGTEGQRMRHEAVAAFSKVDAYGHQYRRIGHKIEGLRDYRFSMAFENHKRDFFFTEKLIDCFATGTVPIYWGCPSIDRFFDPAGMIIVKDMESLRRSMEIVGPDLYEAMLPAIENNFNLARNYYLTEDWLCEKSPKLLDGLAL